MILADTGAVIGLMDARDPQHAVLSELYVQDSDSWVLPWAVLPEIDYLLAARVGTHVEAAFLADLDDGRYVVEWGSDDDVARAHELNRQYRALNLGLVDAVVMAMAERLKAAAIATLDLKHFGAVRLAGAPRLLPRDL